MWETLDFGNIDGSNRLTRKLKDGGLHDILTIVDVVNNTKRIKLTRCFNVSGSGLSPLRNSILLKQLDMSVDDELYSPLSFSEEIVIPILTSIINTDGNSLVYLKLPQKWRKYKYTYREIDTQLTVFLRRYDEVLVSRRMECKSCNQLVAVGRSGYISRTPNNYYGLQNHICYSCLNAFCKDCLLEKRLRYCSNCEKDYCIDCTPFNGECSSSFEHCGNGHCSNCVGLIHCGCGDELCRECKQCGKCGCY